MGQFQLMASERAYNHEAHVVKSTVHRDAVCLGLLVAPYHGTCVQKPDVREFSVNRLYLYRYSRLQLLSKRKLRGVMKALHTCRENKAETCGVGPINEGFMFATASRLCGRAEPATR